MALRPAATESSGGDGANGDGGGATAAATATAAARQEARANGREGLRGACARRFRAAAHAADYTRRARRRQLLHGRPQLARQRIERPRVQQQRAQPRLARVAMGLSLAGMIALHLLEATTTPPARMRAIKSA